MPIDKQQEDDVIRMPIGVMIQSDLSSELFHYIISFLDTNSMFSLMLSNSFNYFNMNENEYFKTLRFLKFMIEPQAAFPLTEGKIVDINDLPSSGNEQLLNQCIKYYNGRVKYLAGREVSFTKCKELIQLKGMMNDNMINKQEQNSDKLNGFHRIISILMSRFKWFNDLAGRDLNCYEFCKVEYLNWVEISKELISASSSNQRDILQSLNIDKISNLMQKTSTFPHGIKELDLLKEKITNLKQAFRGVVNNSEVNQFMEKYNNRRDIFYLMMRLDLLSFDNLPNYLKDDSEFVSFCIRHYDNVNIRTKYGKPRIPNWKMYYEHDYVPTIRLSEKLSSDKSLIRQAFSTGHFELYSSIYLSSYLGRNRTNPFTTNDIEFITSIVSSVPEAISLISYHNEHQLGYSELIEIIRKYPHVFEKLETKFYYYDQFTELCRVAVQSRGENIMHIIYPAKISNITIMEMFKLACENMEYPQKAFRFFKKLPPPIQKNIPFIKQLIPINPGLATYLDRSLFDIDLCFFLSSYVPVRQLIKQIHEWYAEIPEALDCLWCDKEFAKNQLKHFPSEIYEFSEEVVQDPQVFDIIVKSGIDIRAQGLIEEKLMSSPEWIKKTLENGTDIFLFDEAIYSNPEYFKIAMKLKPGIMMMEESYLNNKEMAMYLIDCCKNIGNYFQNADLGDVVFSYFSNELLNDSEFVEKAIFETSTFTDIHNLPIHFQTNLKIVKSTLCKQPKMFIYLRDEIKSMKEIGEFAIRCNPQNYNNLPQHLKDSREIFLFALSRGLKQVKGILNHQPNKNEDPFEWKVTSTQQSKKDVIISTIKIEH